MQRFADLSGLKNFTNKVKSLNTAYSDFNAILNKICQAGSSYASSLYGGSQKVTVSYNINSENTATIYAKGEKIAYLEYGTGEIGRGSYEGELPTLNISFFSERLQTDVTLNGWVYSYAHEIVDSEAPWEGFSAKAQMWKTANYLRDNIASIVKEVVK